MDVTLDDANNDLPRLIRAGQDGERVIITRNGKPVAQITAPPPERKKVELGTMKDRIKFLPGWNDLVDLDQFLDGGI